MIVVIGPLRLWGSGSDAEASGLAASIAVAAAADGARVEVIDKVGDDPAGDAVLLSLARRRVGHVAVLRDAGRVTPVVAATDGASEKPIDPTEADQPDAGSSGPGDAPLDPADAGLALRYLPEIAVIVAVHLPDDVLAEAVAAAGWAETSLIVVVPSEEAAPADVPPGAVTLAAADADESGVGAAIGRYAAALDRGAPADDAYEALIAAGSD